jgi:hypothetical protein
MPEQPTRPTINTNVPRANYDFLSHVEFNRGLDGPAEYLSESAVPPGPGIPYDMYDNSESPILGEDGDKQRAAESPILGEDGDKQRAEQASRVIAEAHRTAELSPPSARLLTLSYLEPRRPAPRPPGVATAARMPRPAQAEAHRTAELSQPSSARLLRLSYLEPRRPAPRPPEPGSRFSEYSDSGVATAARMPRPGKERKATPAQAIAPDKPRKLKKPRPKR